MQLLQFFYNSRRLLNFLSHQCLRAIDTSYSRPFLFQSMFTFRIVICCYQTDPEGIAVIYISIQLQLLSYIFELHDMSMGHSRLICIQLLFLSLEKGLGPIVSPLPTTDHSCSSSQHSFLQWYSQ
jgi:hypothetical protein